MDAHQACSDLHSRTNYFELDAKYYLETLRKVATSGFSPETLAMRRLAADSRLLREIADQIDTERKRLTQQETNHESRRLVPEQISQSR